MKKIILSILFSFNFLWVIAQSKVEMSIQLLTSDLVGNVTLDKDPFFKWIKEVNAEIESHLKNENGNMEVLSVVTIHKTKDVSIEIGAKPALDNKSLQVLIEKVKKIPSPRTKITDYSLAITAKVNEGCNKELAFTPVIVMPFEKEMAAYKALNLSGKKSALQTWIVNDIIPLVAAYETAVDRKFEGVLNIGKIMEQRNYQNADVLKLTELNPDYWRATMEMSQGNQLIPFSKICMHIANGEFDRANSLLFAIRFFSDKTSLPAVLHDDLAERLDLLIQELGMNIQQGIAFHDKGKYKDAVRHYEKLLQEFPKSAWLNYEHYFSKTAEMKETDKVDVEWNRSKVIIYACDPMYPLNVRAKTGKEAYLLFKRQETGGLFKSNENLKGDFVKYADIALDLENYGYAAQLYWLMLGYFSKGDYNDRNILAHYLYCLDKLGDKTTIKNFNGDFPKEFAAIEAERRKIMEESSIYKSFAKKE